MATIQAGGGRRSAAPTYTPYKPFQSAALTADPELLRRSIFDSVTGGVVGDSSTGNSVAEAFGRGVSTLTGQGANSSTSTGEAGPGSATGARALGAGLSALGSLSKDGSLGRVGGLIGLGGALAGARTPGEALGTLAGPALNAIGVPGSVLGLGAAALKGDVSMAVNSVLSMANPTMAALNALSGLLGIGTVGGAVKNGLQNVNLGGTIAPDAGILGQYAAGSEVNNAPDPLGAFAAAMKDAWGYNVADDVSGTMSDPNSGANSGRGSGYNVGNSLGTGYGVTGSGLGGRGGYGGGIGQSGGNAAGVGSHQG